MTIRRVNHGNSHSYRDDTGAKWPGVTTLTGDGIPKKAIEKWAINETIDYALDNWYELSKMKPSERRKKLLGARWEAVDRSRARGTKVHKLAERIVAGERVKIPEGLEGYVEGYVQFVNDFDVAPVLVEAVIVSHRRRYCGTLDLIADLLDPDDLDEEGRRQRWLLDLTTGKPGGGVFGEKALQVVGYRYADAVVAEDGSESPVPEVERTGVVYISPTGTQLVEVLATEVEYRKFLYAQQVALMQDDLPQLVGEVVTPPPRSRTWRLEQA